MRRLYVFLFFFTLSAAGIAQPFGNEWIVYSEKSLKIRVVNDGIYRIDSTTLATSIQQVGGSLGMIDPRNLQLFHNGQEEYIYVEGESDGVFNGSDFLEFYGKRNDGAMDAELYGGSQNQLNPYYSLYNDTAIYFLTWNSSISNRRLVNPNDTTFSAYATAPYFTNNEVFYGQGQYLPGVEDPNGITDPAFLNSEGWYDYPFYYGHGVTRNLNTLNAYTANNDSAKIHVRVASTSNDWTYNLGDNEIQITSNLSAINFDTTYDGFQLHTFSFYPSVTTLGASTSITVNSVNPGNASASSGRTTIAYITLSYPHTFDMEYRLRFNGMLPDNPNQSK